MEKTLIKELRRQAGLTQEVVADKLGVSRPTYVALESGKSELGLSSIKVLAELYQVPPGDIVAGRLSSCEPEGMLGVPADSVPNIPAQDSSDPDTVPRETDPAVCPDKLRNVLLYILEHIGAKPNVGETVLYKLLYFIDFDYYEKTGCSVTGLTYIKNHYGPTPARQFEGIVGGMVAARELDIVETPYFAHTQKKYLPIVRANLTSLSAVEIKHIDEVLARLGDKSASELSEFSHKDMPWVATKLHRPISYQLAMYRTNATSVRNPDSEL